MDISRRHLLSGMGMLPLLALNPRMARTATRFIPGSVRESACPGNGL